MRFIGLGGEPSTGKSSIMKEILRKLGEGYDFKFDLLRGKKYPYFNPKLIVLGIYEEGVLFCGTDRLSMIAIKSIKDLVNFCVDNDVFLDYTILFEGDRFFKQNFFELLEQKKINYSLYIIKVEDSVLKQRRDSRADNNQSEVFLKGRRTMYSNVEQVYAQKVRLLQNTTVEDLQNNVKVIWNDLGYN